MPSYLPDTMPQPQPSQDDAPFWSACNEGRLLIRHCNDCQQFSHPLMPACLQCAFTRMVEGSQWQRHRIHLHHHPTHSALKGNVAYNVAVVLLDGAGDVRLVSNVVDVAPEDMKIGLPVSVYWDDVGQGVQLPPFQAPVESNQRDGGES